VTAITGWRFTAITGWRLRTQSFLVPRRGRVKRWRREQAGRSRGRPSALTRPAAEPAQAFFLALGLPTRAAIFRRATGLGTDERPASKGRGTPHLPGRCGAGGDRLEAAWIALPIGPLAGLVEVQESISRRVGPTIDAMLRPSGLGLCFSGTASPRLSHSQSSCAAGSRRRLPSVARYSW
jgi:hypothetical protein